MKPCVTCRFSIRIAGRAPRRDVECRRHAPKPTEGDPGAVQWPVVDGGGCGEHRPSTAPVEAEE